MEKLTKVSFSNLDKILFPQQKITKAHFIEYIIKVAPKMLPFLKDRPLVLTRYPEGVDKEGFYAKNAPEGTPSWVQTTTIYSPSAKRDVNYVLCNDIDTLLWLANLVAIEIHMPLSTVPKRETPDFAFFDVDPEPPATFWDAVEVALLIKEKLDALGLVGYVKTSGKKGLHILVPLVRRYTFKHTRAFVHTVGIQLMKENSKVVSEFKDTKTPDKVFVDYMQNSHGRTMACPYSLRAISDASASTPIPWAALKKKLKPSTFNIHSVPSLKEEPWNDIFENRQKLEAK
jgi:bifunctional non-homologous end joining protein LigD